MKDRCYLLILWLVSALIALVLVAGVLRAVGG